MIAGFEYPDSGSITVDGKAITNLPPNKRNVGMVFQSYALFPNMTVAEQHRLRHEGQEATEGRHPQARRRAARADQHVREGRSLSVPAVRRPAAARRARAGARDRAPGAAARRAAVGARRQDPGRAAQRDPGDPAAARHHHGLRHARPGGGAVAVGSGRGHEPGSDRTDRHALRDLQLPRDRVRGLVRRHAQPGRRAWSSMRAAGRLTLAGQEIRTAKPITVAGAGARVTLAVRPEGIELGERRAEAGTGSAARSRTSTSSARSSGSASGLGEAGRWRTADHRSRSTRSTSRICGCPRSGIR